MRRASRRIVVVAATACFAAAYALTPAEVRSRLAPAPAPAPARSPATAAPFVPDLPASDPFVPRAADPPAAPLARAPLAVAPRDTVARVDAIAVGAHPEALVVDASGSHLVGLGDRAGDAPVTGIDASGVTLGDGRRLLLPGAGTP